MSCASNKVEELKTSLMVATDDEIIEICGAVDISCDFVDGIFLRSEAVLQILLLPLRNNINTDKLDAIIDG